MVRLSLAPGKITVRLNDPNDWIVVENLAGKVKNIGPGTYEIALSFQNLQKLYRVFTGPNKPVVVDGHWLMDKKREEMVKFNSGRRKLEEALSAASYPIEPNGKFIPYAHQTRIIGSVINYPHTMVAADCGLGKTGSLGRAMELLIQNGEIKSGKILVSAPLSILNASWVDDLQKFTHLRYKILWTPDSNKRLYLGDKKLLAHYGDKPADTLTTKTKKSVLYQHKSLVKGVKQKLNQLDQPHSDWVKYEATHKESINQLGERTPFGECWGKPIGTESTRENFIKESLKDANTDVFIINHDGVRIYEEILTAHEFEWVIVDESTKIKSIKSKVTSAHIGVSQHAKRRTVLSGTPNPNGFVDLWSQFYFLDRGATLHPSLKDYLHEYFRAEVIGNFKIPGSHERRDAIKYVMRSPEHQTTLVEHVRKSGIFLQQRDCIDLPPRTDMRRIVNLTEAQQRAYEDMEEELVAGFLDVKTDAHITVEAVNTLAKIMKLRQITSGFLTGNDGHIGSFDQNPKLSDLDDFIEELGDKKIVIACQFKEEIHQLLDRYKSCGVAAIYGDVKLSDRTQSIKDFQTTDQLRIMVLQPQAAAHGITLTAANYLMFFSLDYNFEYYYQTAKRIERLGQKNNIFVVHSLARFEDGTSTIDEDLMSVLNGKRGDRDRLFSPGQDAVEIASVLRQRLVDRVQGRKK